MFEKTNHKKLFMRKIRESAKTMARKMTTFLTPSDGKFVDFFSASEKQEIYMQG